VNFSRALFVAALAILVVSGIAPADRATWWLEVAPVVVGAAVLLATRRHFPWTPLAKALMLVHALVLCVGGHWTYAQVPAGNWLRDALGLARNPYDRLGHLMQGFVPALLAREVFLRRAVVRRGAWLFFLVTCFALALSAAYELFEWLAAVTLGAGADSFLGTQGDPWDTQWDMLCALVGAVLAQLALARVQERQIERLTSSGSRATPPGR
jgi:putative membrane protein